MTFNPDYVVSPWETVKECIDDAIHFDRKIGYEEISALMRLFPNIPKEFWVSLENNYRQVKKTADSADSGE